MFGYNGQLGRELHSLLAVMGEVCPGYLADFRRPDSVRQVIKDIFPGLIVNAAAYTKVDKAEEEEEEARMVNAVSVGVLAEEALALHIPLIHYSTDYVFDGLKETPYTEEDIPNPINVYGKTKLEGEKAIQQVGCEHLILRTSWLYSVGGDRGFVNKILIAAHKCAARKEGIKVVEDQVGSPTWTAYLAASTLLIIQSWEKSGVYHISGGGQVSRYDFAKSVLRNCNDSWLRMVVPVEPVLSSQLKEPAKRPAFSALSSQRMLSGYPVVGMTWLDMLRLAFRR